MAKTYPTDHPTVYYADLVDGHDFKDSAFKGEVTRFMERYMPGGPMGLLDTENIERWQVESASVHVVEEVTWTDEDEDEDEDEKGAENTGWVIRNTDTSELAYDFNGYAHRRDLDYKPDHALDLEGHADVFVWSDKAEALASVGLLDRLYEDSNCSYAFPWAHSWFFIPDHFIKDADLKDAGFTVAHYTGGAGGAGVSYRLAGIDGGGYDFETQHYARLCALIYESREWAVATDNGLAYLTFEGSDLERLAREEQ